MKCCATQKQLTPLLLGELEHGDADQVLRHVRDCLQCRREMDALGLTMDLMRELPALPFPSEIDAQLAQRIVAEEQPVRPRVARRLRARAMAAVAAAAIAVAVVILEARFIAIPGAGSGEVAALGSGVVIKGGATLEGPSAAAATVLDASGEPQIAVRGRTSPARPNAEVPFLGRIVTGEADRVDLELMDGSRVRVGFDSCVEVRPGRPDGAHSQAVALYVHRGQAWVWPAGDGDGLRVRYADNRESLKAAEAIVSVRPEAGGQVHRAALYTRHIERESDPEGETAHWEELVPGAEPQALSLKHGPPLSILRIRSPLGRYYSVWRAPMLPRRELLDRLDRSASDEPLLVAARQMAEDGRLAEAERFYSRAGAADAECLTSRLNLALIRQFGGDWRGAVEPCAEAVKLAPDDPRTRWAYGQSLLGIGNARRGAEELARAVELDPGLHRARYLLGLSLLLDERVGESRRQAEWLRANSDRLDLAHLLRGEIHFLARRFQNAFDSFEQAVAANPTSFEAELRLGAAALALPVPRVEVIEATARKADDHNPASAVAFNRLGLLYGRQASRLDDWLEETHDANLTKRLVAAGLEAFTNAERNEVAGERDRKRRQSEHWLRRALELQPDRAEAYSNIASLAHSSGDLQAAHRYYSRAAGLDPTLAPVRYGWGLTLEDLERYSEAEAQYRLALRLDPTDNRPAKQLAHMWEMQHRVADAEQVRLRYWL